ncbi:short-chain dehydrogenase [Vandammella animalimorsus]|uniref:Short-chain dehydrogenase n=1 Tax=Vandammella animalimorsus TaxID=2029117 RepID=A0A2A2T5F9_9BURK|nr:SDR family NAD(P)-dependent oxidoreductase [Vandammella animalimorsus]PAT32202.1 short-chain dehydrogenase [Vandammella animalimorsus]PAX16688.1 short-chain dehydrogenase [Vandammella animalimorsus]PAX19318.1 short-chain dehydrogenase [Vandammella animalimorsus]
MPAQHNSPGEAPIALVTGGARGMGLATVERLCDDGFQVIWLDRDTQAVAAAKAQMAHHKRHIPCVLDLSDEAAIRTFVRSLPPIQALVNNAGLFTERSFEQVSTQDFEQAYRINLMAAAILTQEVARCMPDGGRIVNIASRAYLGARHHPHYVAAKAALVGYTRACAMELAHRDILVNAIAPGLIDTPMLRTLSPERLAQQLALQPTGKAGSPKDIAQAVAFLVSPRTRFITGQVLIVDGGKSLGGSLA